MIINVFSANYYIGSNVENWPAVAQEVESLSSRLKIRVSPVLSVLGQGITFKC